jgi:cell division protein FtsW
MPRVLKFDRWICATVLVLMFFGLVMVFSVTTGGETSSFRFIIRQSAAALLGLAAMRFLMFFDYRQLSAQKTVFIVLGVSIVLLVVVLLSPQAANTHRFLRVGGLFSVQPSEFAKLALILFLAFFLDKHSGRLNDWRTLSGAGLILAVFAALVLAGKDLGTTITLLLIAGVVLWVAGLHTSYLWKLGLAGALLAALGIWLQPWRLDRILIFLNPESDPTNAGFQILQSKIAVGTGGLFGQGLMEGRQKLLFLPEAHTDFIFAVICEELGLIAACLVVLAFAVLLWRGIWVSFRAPDRFGCYLAAGITAMIVCQAMINLGVVLAMLPTKGMPLPFISYGGTAMIAALAASGVLLNISRHAE